MNVLLLVVDSLRAASLRGDQVSTPFLDELATSTTTFERAHATECWTLPSHVSMFTGLLPSAHQAHFQTMAYRGSAPTIAELAGAMGHHTELATRNSIFDGSMPGVTRGFQVSTRRFSSRSTGLNPLALMLALSKPRFRRQILSSGFFHPRQRETRAFVTEFARAMAPADDELLEDVVDHLATLRRKNRPFFVFANLYDVHAPYPPRDHSIFRSWTSPPAILENVTMPFVLPALGGHRYLEDGFQMSDRSTRLLLERYHDAIRLMDGKLARFWSAIRNLGLLDDTLVVVTSDHGEAFGDHDLFLHDASVYQTHLHVPLYVHHPSTAPSVVPDVVSTMDLFGLMKTALSGSAAAGTLLDPEYRGMRGAAFSQHFHYPHAPRAAARYCHDLSSVVVGRWKLVLRSGSPEVYDLVRDPAEAVPLSATADDFVDLCAAEGLGKRAADAVRTMVPVARRVASHDTRVAGLA